MNSNDKMHSAFANIHLGNKITALPLLIRTSYFFLIPNPPDQLKIRIPHRPRLFNTSRESRWKEYGAQENEWSSSPNNYTVVPAPPDSFACLRRPKRALCDAQTTPLAERPAGALCEAEKLLEGRNKKGQWEF